MGKFKKHSSSRQADHIKGQTKKWRPEPTQKNGAHSEKPYE